MTAPLDPEQISEWKAQAETNAIACRDDRYDLGPAVLDLIDEVERLRAFPAEMLSFAAQLRARGEARQTDREFARVVADAFEQFAKAHGS